jgi:thioredoxin:protein disulfide reductase
LPERWTMIAWMVPLIALAIVLGRAPLKTAGSRAAARAGAGMATVYAILLAIGFYTGSTDPLHPLQARAAHLELPFQRIKSLDDLNAEVAKAKAAGKSVMLDFYADWCVSCKEMEKYTFPEPEVRAALSNTVWLQADVTANDETDKALMKHFGIFGPPSIRFFGADGVERSEFKHAGFLKAGKFAPLVTRALK